MAISESYAARTASTEHAHALPGAARAGSVERTIGASVVVVVLHDRTEVLLFELLG